MSTIPSDTRILITRSVAIPGYHVALASGLGEVTVFSDLIDASMYVEKKLNGKFISKIANNGAYVWFYA